MRSRFFVALFAVAPLAACSSSTAMNRTATTRQATPSSRAPLAWTACNAGAECAQIVVPVHRGEPHGSSLTLTVGRLRATDESHTIGVLLIPPTGSGLGTLRRASELLSSTLLARFDVVSWDARGTGASSPVTCGADLDSFFILDRSGTGDDPASDSLIAGAARVARQCRLRTSALLRHLGPAGTVDDIESVRVALGATTINLLDLSGGRLATMYVDRHAANVRAWVIDGPGDLMASSVDSGDREAADAAIVAGARSREGELRRFFAWCRHATECSFHGGGAAARSYDALIARLRHAPLVTQAGAEARTIGPGTVQAGVFAALLRGKTGWSRLASDLASVERGDGIDLLEDADYLVGRHLAARYDGSYLASLASGCDAAGSIDQRLARMRVLARRLAAVAPRLGPIDAWWGAPCVYLDWRTGATTNVTPPNNATSPVVVTARNDPASPIAIARATANFLHAPLILASGSRHTNYEPNQPCITRLVDAYLVTLNVPRSTNCPPPAGR